MLTPMARRLDCDCKHRVTEDAVAFVPAVPCAIERVGLCWSLEVSTDICSRSDQEAGRNQDAAPHPSTTSTGGLRAAGSETGTYSVGRARPLDLPSPGGGFPHAVGTSLVGASRPLRRGRRISRTPRASRTVCERPSRLWWSWPDLNRHPA